MRPAIGKYRVVAQGNVNAHIARPHRAGNHAAAGRNRIAAQPEIASAEQQAVTAGTVAAGLYTAVIESIGPVQYGDPGAPRHQLPAIAGDDTVIDLILCSVIGG